MSRIPTIEQYRERALDQAALLSALAMAHVDGASDLRVLASRQDAQLREWLHTFAFTARKLIETVKRDALPSAAYAARPTVCCGREGTADAFEMASMSLIEILGRIIHSDDLSIDRTRVPKPDGSREGGDSAWAFRVASDRDPEGTANFVYTEFLLQEFLHFDEQLERDLHRARLLQGESRASAT